MTDSLATNAPSKYIVVRSAVPSREPYTEYLRELRIDFWFSCAYCTMCEAEAQAIAFSIDHYEPQTARTDLICTYSNLMYACTICNSFKQNVTPPACARAAGYRFFKADQDDASEHFVLEGETIRPLTNVGKLTISALNLNRPVLRAPAANAKASRGFDG